MTHLNDAQIDDLLIGDAAAETRAHIDACSDCAARLAAVLEPMASFNAASLAWGERRSATLPSQLQPKQAGLFPGGRLRVAVAAAVFALVLALPFLHHGSAPTTTAHQPAPAPSSRQTILTAAAPPAATAPDTDSSQPRTLEEQQIARDNQLLQAINRELATTETPAELLKMASQQDGNQSSPDATHNE